MTGQSTSIIIFLLELFWRAQYDVHIYGPKLRFIMLFKAWTSSILSLPSHIYTPTSGIAFIKHPNNDLGEILAFKLSFLGLRVLSKELLSMYRKAYCVWFGSKFFQFMIKILLWHIISLNIWAWLPSLGMLSDNGWLRSNPVTHRQPRSIQAYDINQLQKQEQKNCYALLSASDCFAGLSNL